MGEITLVPGLYLDIGPCVQLTINNSCYTLYGLARLATDLRGSVSTHIGSRLI